MSQYSRSCESLGRLIALCSSLGRLPEAAFILRSTVYTYSLEVNSTCDEYGEFSIDS